MSISDDVAHWWFLGVGEQEGHWEVLKGVQQFTVEDLARATQDFSKEHEIGSGSFGKVFVGSFPSSKSLAIKRASTSTSDNGQMEFRNEVNYYSLADAILLSNVQRITDHWLEEVMRIWNFTV